MHAGLPQGIKLITLDDINSLPLDEFSLFWVVFHEGTPAGYYGKEPDVTTLLKEARRVANSIENFANSYYEKPISITDVVWDKGHINYGTRKGPKVVWNEAWNGRPGKPEEGINWHVTHSDTNFSVRLKLYIVYNAVKTRGESPLPSSEYRFWRAVGAGHQYDSLPDALPYTAVEDGQINRFKSGREVH